MSTSFYLETDFYSDFPRPGEREFQRTPSLSILEDLRATIQSLKLPLQVNPSSEDGIFTLDYQSLFGGDRSLKFRLSPYREKYMFGWYHEGYFQERSWHYIIKDVIGAYLVW